MADKPRLLKSAEPSQEQDGRDAALEALSREYSLSLQSKQFQSADPNVSGLDWLGVAGYSLIHDGVQAPFRSLGQIVDSGVKKTIGVESKFADVVTVMPAVDEAPYRSNSWWAQQFGSGLGLTLPFMLTKGALKTTGLSLLPKAESTAMASTKFLSTSKGLMVADSAMVGFASDFVFRPVEAGDGSQLEARAKHGLVGAAVMSTMTVGNLGLRHMSGSVARNMVGDSVTKRAGRTLYDVGTGAASGAPAGVVSADASALIFHNRFSTGEERSKAAFTMTTMGGALSALHQLPRDKAGFELRSKPLKPGFPISEVKPVQQQLLSRDGSARSASSMVADRRAGKTGTEALANELKQSKIPSEYNAEAKAKTQALIDDQVAFLKTKSIEGQKPVEEIQFDTPQRNGVSPVDPEMKVTNVKRYANGVFVYENKNGLEKFDGANRLITDHETFVQTDWNKPHTLTDGFMTGGQVTSKLLRRGHSDTYTNPDGLFGKGTDSILIAESYGGTNGDTRYSPVRLVPGEGRVEANPAKYEQSVKAVAEKYNRTELDTEIHKIVERSSNTTEAQKILDASKRGLDGRALVDFLGKASLEAQAWLTANGTEVKSFTTIYSPKADGSASPLRYVMGKAAPGLFDLKALPPTLPDTPILIFGDVTKLSALELKALQQHKKPIAIIDPAFERGVNVIDLVNGTADAKVKSLVEQSKQQGDVIDGPARDLASKLNAKLINPPTNVTPLTEQGLKNYLEATYPNKNDRAIAAELFANGIDYISMFDYARGIKRLISEIAARGEGTLAAQQDVYFVQDGRKSSELMNYFAQQLTGVTPDRMVSHSKAVELAKTSTNKIWLLDDAIYTGDQMSTRAHGIRSSDNVNVATLAAYPKGVEALDGLNLLTVKRPTPLSVELTPQFLGLSPVERQRQLPVGGIIDGQMQSVSEALAFKRFYHSHATNQRWGGFGSRTSLFYMSPDNSPFFVRDFLNRNLGTPRAFNEDNHLSRPFFEKPKDQE